MAAKPETMDRRRRKLTLGCGIILSALVFAVLVLLLIGGLAMEAGYLPNTEALPAGRLPDRQLRQLQQLGVTRPGEKVLYFYSAGIVNIREDGNLVTDQRVASYQGMDTGLDITEARFDEIATVDHLPGWWLEDSRILVTKRDGKRFVLLASTEAGGDKLFYQAVMDEWAKHLDAGAVADVENGGP